MPNSPQSVVVCDSFSSIWNYNMLENLWRLEQFVRSILSASLRPAPYWAATAPREAALSARRFADVDV